MRITEKVDTIARQIYADYRDTRLRGDAGRIYRSILNRLQTDRYLVKQFSDGLLKVLAEGMTMQIVIAFMY